MSDFLDDVALHLHVWLDHYVATRLEGSVPDPAAIAQFRALGEVFREVAKNKPARVPAVAGLPPEADPLLVAQKALAGVFSPSIHTFPEVSFGVLLEAGTSIEEAVKTAQDEAAQAAEAAPPSAADEALATAPAAPAPISGGPNIAAATPVVPVTGPPATGAPTGASGAPASLPSPKWMISLWAWRVHCKKETAGPGQDEFVLMGNYVYSDAGKALNPLSGDFDTGTVLTLSRTKEPHGRLLAQEMVKPSTEYLDFTVTLVGLEDDGMSATAARVFAGLIGGLVTLGVNALFSSAKASGVTIPPQAESAYRNLGLPGLIGTLAKAFGPDPFLPVQALAKISWPASTPAEPPKWTAMIPMPGGKMKSHSGEDKHMGSITLVEAELDAVTVPGGAEVQKLVGLLNKGEYYVYLTFLMQKV